LVGRKKTIRIYVSTDGREQQFPIALD